MSKRENITIRIPGIPGRDTKPRSMGASTPRSTSLRTVTMVAAITVPVMLPIPPNTTISKISKVR